MTAVDRSPESDNRWSEPDNRSSEPDSPSSGQDSGLDLLAGEPPQVRSTLAASNPSSTAVFKKVFCLRQLWRRQGGVAPCAAVAVRKSLVRLLGHPLDAGGNRDASRLERRRAVSTDVAAQEKSLLFAFDFGVLQSL